MTWQESHAVTAALSMGSEEDDHSKELCTQLQPGGQNLSLSFLHIN